MVPVVVALAVGPAVVSLSGGRSGTAIRCRCGRSRRPSPVAAPCAGRREACSDGPVARPPHKDSVQGFIDDAATGALRQVAGERPAGQESPHAQRGSTSGMTNQLLDPLALRSDERAALLLVGLRGDF